MRRFYIDPDDLKQAPPRLAGSEARHIAATLRMKPGDQITLFDGMGHEYEATLISVSPRQVEVALSREYPSVPESPVQITIAQALLKDRKMDRLIRQFTELGIYRVIPLASERSIPAPDPKRFASRQHRWHKIIVEAMKQCRRTRFLEMSPLETLPALLTRGQAFDVRMIFWENETAPLDLALTEMQPPCTTILAVVGPEGGFTSQEIQQARASGFISASLGPRTLKAETASVATGVLLQHHFGDMGQKAVDNIRDL